MLTAAGPKPKLQIPGDAHDKKTILLHTHPDKGSTMSAAGVCVQPQRAGRNRMDVLFTMSNSRQNRVFRQRSCKPCSCGRDHPRLNTKVVEPDGIEPTTSCLQSTRSPN
jgi:hypothetical protein